MYIISINTSTLFVALIKLLPVAEPTVEMLYQVKKAVTAKGKHDVNFTCTASGFSDLIKLALHYNYPRRPSIETGCFKSDHGYWGGIPDSDINYIEGVESLADPLDFCDWTGDVTGFRIHVDLLVAYSVTLAGTFFCVGYGQSAGTVSSKRVEFSEITCENNF